MLNNREEILAAGGSGGDIRLVYLLAP